jgi:glycosyltransferase involved in cell wall biosynthesis
MKVSVVIPAHNEEQTLPWVLRDLNDTTASLPHDEFEIIVVDDHSSDATANVSRQFGAMVVHNEGRGGKGMALRAGFARATGDVIVMMDADYSHRAEDLPVLLQSLTGATGLVIGSRVYGGSDEYTPVRALGNVFLTAALGLCTGRFLSDALNGYKAFRRDVFTDFTYTSRAFEIEIELVANALRKGYKVVECSSHERVRAGGEAKSRVVRHGTRFLLRIIREALKGMKPVTTAPAAAAVDASGRQPMAQGGSSNRAR